MTPSTTTIVLGSSTFSVSIEHDKKARLYSAYVAGIPGCGEASTVAEAIEDLKNSLKAYADLHD